VIQYLIEHVIELQKQIQYGQFIQGIAETEVYPETRRDKNQQPDRQMFYGCMNKVTIWFIKILSLVFILMAGQIIEK